MPQIDPYASIAQPIANTPPPPASGDPYASIAQPVAPSANPQDLANHALEGSGITVGGQPSAVPSELATPPSTVERAAYNLQHNKFLNTLGDFAQAASGASEARGAVKALGQTVMGADNLIRLGMRKVGVDPDKHPSIAAPVDETDFGLPKGSLDTQGVGEGVGGIEENILEFMYGEGELKTMTSPEKFKALARATETLEKYPRLAAATHATISAFRQATVAGTQTLLKTNGNEDAATDAAIWTAGLALLTHGASAGVLKWLRNRAATSEIVNGTQVTVPADVRNARPTPAQEQAQKVYGDVARESARPALEGIDQTRAPQKPTLALPEKTGPFEFTIEGQPTRTETTGSPVVRAAAMPRENITNLPESPTPGSSRNAVKQMSELGSTAGTIPPQMINDQPFMTSAATGEQLEESTTSGAGTLKTTDVRIAREHLQNLNDTIDSAKFGKLPQSEQDALLRARGSIQRQLTEFEQHHASLAEQAQKARGSVLPRLSVNEILNRVHDFTGAADAIDEHAQAIYQKADELSEGAFKRAKDDLGVAQKARFNATGKDSYADAVGREMEAHRRMEDVVTGLKSKMAPEEIGAARQAFRQGYVLRDIANTLDSSTSGIPGSSNRANAYRGIDGNKLMTNLNRLVRTMGRGQVESAIGGQRLEALERIAELNRTNEQRARFGAVIQKVSQYINPHVSTFTLGGAAGSHLMGIPWEVGAAAGYFAGQAVDRVMKAVLGNPRIAQNLIFAIDSGAKPERFGPMLGTMIQTTLTAQAREEQAQKNSENREDNNGKE